MTAISPSSFFTFPQQWAQGCKHLDAKPKLPHLRLPTQLAAPLPGAHGLPPQTRETPDPISQSCAMSVSGSPNNSKEQTK